MDLFLVLGVEFEVRLDPLCLHYRLKSISILLNPVPVLMHLNSLLCSFLLLLKTHLFCKLKSCLILVNAVQSLVFAEDLSQLLLGFNVLFEVRVLLPVSGDELPQVFFNPWLGSFIEYFSFFQSFNNIALRLGPASQFRSPLVHVSKSLVLHLLDHTYESPLLISIF